MPSRIGFGLKYEPFSLSPILPVDEDDDVEIQFRDDADAGTGEAGMAKTPRRERLS